MKYTVKKSRRNRIALRFVALLFILIAALRMVVVVTTKEHTSVIITILLCAGGLTYGIYLLVQTLKPQAYDITYVFGDQTLTLQLHHKEQVVSYGDITDLGYVVPSPNLDYSIVQIYIGKKQYMIPFNGNSNVGEALYGMLKIKQEEAEQTK